jgi:RNA polymerase sigma factor for flagellar operon FliA
MAYERSETTNRVRAAIATLPEREQKVISLYYYKEATMKEIGQQIGVNESRVSQLHARAIRRLKDALEQMMPVEAAKQALRAAILEFRQKPEMVKATLKPAAVSAAASATTIPATAVVLAMGPAEVAPTNSWRGQAARSAARKGLAGHGQPLSSRKRSLSMPATSTAAKMTRRAHVAVAAAMAR